jgi:hypothetical protein
MTYFKTFILRSSQQVLPLDHARELLDHYDSVETGWSGGVVVLEPNPDYAETPEADTLRMASNLVIVSDRARAALESVVRPSMVEWIEAEYQGRRWWMLHARKVIDAIDEERSKLDRVSSTDNKVFCIHKLVIRGDRCAGYTIFRLARGLEAHFCVVSSDFVEAWTAAKLEGMAFNPLECS